MNGTAANSTRVGTWTFPKAFVAGSVGVSWYFMEGTSELGYHNSAASNFTTGTSISFSGYATSTGTSYYTATAIGRIA